MTTPEVGTETWVPELTFGARLALVRHRMGWNLKEAAAACGLPGQSWRSWEVDGREPHRIVTIAMAIATRTGCDLDWLVYGPEKGGVRTIKTTTSTMGSRQHVVATMRPVVAPENGLSDLRAAGNRPVRQTRPIIGGRPQPLSLSSAH